MGREEGDFAFVACTGLQVIVGSDRASSSPSFYLRFLPFAPRPVLDSREERGRDGDDAAARKEGGREGERNIAWGVWEEEGDSTQVGKGGGEGSGRRRPLLGLHVEREQSSLGGRWKRVGSKAGRGKKEIPAGMVTRGGRGEKRNKRDSRKVRRRRRRSTTYSLSPLSKTPKGAQHSRHGTEDGGEEESRKGKKIVGHSLMLACPPFSIVFLFPFIEKEEEEKGGGRAFQNGPRRRGGRKSQTAGGDSKQSCRKEERGREEEEGRWKTKKELSFSFSPTFWQ